MLVIGKIAATIWALIALALAIGAAVDHYWLAAVAFAASAVLAVPFIPLYYGPKKRALFSGGAALVGIIAIAASAPALVGEPAAKEAPPAAPAEQQAANPPLPASAPVELRRLQDADKQIATVDAYPMTGHATVKVDLPESWSASQLPFQAAMVVTAAGKAIKAGAQEISPEIKTITFWFTAPVLDSYGREDRRKVLQFTLKTEDLRLIEYDNVPTQRVLEFGYDVSFGGPAGRQATEGYCAKNESDNPRFCSNLVR